MPIFTYFAVVGSVLIALMFVTNATLETRRPGDRHQRSNWSAKAKAPAS